MEGGGATVVVIGGSNVDVIARPSVAALPATSNPGRVTVTPGGVGRNIAENLARLGTAVHLVSAVGADAHGDLVVTRTAEPGVDVGLVRRVRAATGTYVALLDAAGELVSAVSDMAATALLGDADVRAARERIAAAELLVLDGNLPGAVLRAAWETAAAAGVRVVIDPVSVPKAAAVGTLLGPGLPLFLLSAGSTELLAVRTGAGACGAADPAVDMVWERAGAEGSVLSVGADTYRFASRAADVVDVTGAGDAMLAAFCHALLTGADPREAADYGHAAAALTVSSRHTVRPDLSDALVRSLP